MIQPRGRFVNQPRRILSLAALALLPFLPALCQPFFADDYIHLERARAIDPPFRAWVLEARDASAWWVDPDLSVRYFRPLVSLSFRADWILWGPRPFGFHLTNLAMHVSTTLLVYSIAGILLGPGRSAWAAAALFAVHPCHSEAVVWISGRTDLLAGLLVALAFRLHLGRYLVSSLAVFALSLLSKEMAVTFPALVLVHELVYGNGRLPKRLIAPALAGCVLLVYFALRIWTLGSFDSPPHPFFHRPGDPDMASSVLHTSVMYLADLVLFVPCDPVVTLPFWRSHPFAFAVLAIATVGLLVSTLRVASSEHRGFASAWIAVSLVPVLAVSPGERFLYLPSLGYCLLIAARKEEAWRRAVPLLIGIAAVALLKSFAFGQLASRSRDVVEDAVRRIDRPGTRLVLTTDLPEGAALGFAHALRLERPHLQVEILSIAPGFLNFDARAPAARDVTARGFELSIPRAYWDSYIARAFWAERKPFAPGDRVHRGEFEVEVLEVEGGRPTRIGVHLGEGWEETTVVLPGVFVR